MSGDVTYLTQIYGPTSAAPASGGSAIAVAPEMRRALTQRFSEQLDHSHNKLVQMLVETPGFDPIVINFHRRGGSGAALLLQANAAGEKPLLAGACVMLSGSNTGDDIDAIHVIEQSADAAGARLPLAPKIFQRLREGPRPLLGLLCFTEETVKDPSLRLTAACLADAVFAAGR